MDIIDNGKGLPGDDRQKLLEPYMTTRQKGTGLGLAIVRKILEDHGGTIELMDAPEVANGGRGAMMRLRIPLYAEVLAPQAPEEEELRAKPVTDDEGRIDNPDLNGTNNEKEAAS